MNLIFTRYKNLNRTLARVAQNIKGEKNLFGDKAQAARILLLAKATVRQKSRSQCCYFKLSRANLRKQQRQCWTIVCLFIPGSRSLLVCTNIYDDIHHHLGSATAPLTGLAGMSQPFEWLSVNKHSATDTSCRRFYAKMNFQMKNKPITLWWRAFLHLYGLDYHGYDPHLSF